MKKLIYAPKIFTTNHCLSDRVNHFFIGLERKYGFETIYSDSLTDRTAGASLILIYAGYHGHQLLRESVKLIRQIKIIYLLTGPHSFSMNLIAPVIERGDLILITYREFFSKRFPNFMTKVNFFPLYFAPHERYAKLNWNRKPIMKCLLTGHANPDLYPLRDYLLGKLKENSGLGRIMEAMRHPRWGIKKPLASYEIPSALNEAYALVLNRYYCSIATDSRYQYGLAKYFEIPAAGCLLLGKKTPDIDLAGLIPWKHYVPIDKRNCISQLRFCLADPRAFNFIRKAGRDFVRMNHSVRNRVKEFGQFLERI